MFIKKYSLLAFFSLLFVAFFVLGSILHSYFLIIPYFFIGLIVIFTWVQLYDFPISTYLWVASIIALIAVSLSLQLVLPYLAGPDEQEYYNNLMYIPVDVLWQRLVDNFNVTTLGFVTVNYGFPALLHISFPWFSVLPGEFIALVNIFFWATAILLWVKVVNGQIAAGNGRSLFPYVLFFTMLMSPSSIYWSSVFAKDVITTSLTVYAAICFYKRSFLWFAVWLFLATIMRPHAIVFVVSFAVFLEFLRRPHGVALLCIGSAASVLLLILLSGSGLASINAFALMLYLFVSPNPLDLSNYNLFFDNGTWVFSPILFTIEGLFIGILFVFGLPGLFISKYSFSRVRRVLFLSLLMSSCGIAAVGAFLLLREGNSYELFAFGDNVVRKKFAVWPLICVWVSLSLCEIFGSISSFNKRRIANQFCG